MLTLMLSLLLKIPADQLEHEGLTLSFVGSCMLAKTLIIPGVALAVGFLAVGEAAAEVAKVLLITAS